jgi:hypothetical protein
VLVTADGDSRALARELLATPAVDAVRLTNGTIEVETSDPSALSKGLPVAAVRAQALLQAIRPVGDDLESVYTYLHERARGQAR